MEKEHGMACRIRVIACGNPFMGNDSVGLRVMERLGQKYPALDMVDGGLGGLGLIPLMEGYDRIIIVDATCGCGSPGEINVFRSPPPSRYFPMSLHDLGIAETLAIAEELGIMPDVVIVGIEGGSVEEFSDRLDSAVEEAIEHACASVIEEINRGC